MKFIDMFSGIGGFRSALELNGHECIGYSEIDKYAKQSYQAIYDTENEVDLGDITEISQEYLSQFKEENDIVVGGSPCQAFSLAGKRKGFEDTRGTLFFEYAKVVKETQPKYFLFENVKGMLSHDKGNTIRVVLETFNELGYYIDFNIFNSKYYGVPQNRERIYIVGKRKDLVEQPKYHDKTKGKKKFDEIHNWAVDNINYVELLPQLQTEITTRLVDVLEDEVDEKFYLPKEKIEKLVMNLDSNEVIGVREATKQGYAVAEQGDSVNVTYPDSKTRRGRVGKQVAQTLQAGEVNQGVVMEDKGIRFTEDGFHTHRNDKKKSSIQGTHVTYKTGKTHALTSNHVPKTIEGLRIRKLTPLECWRLQGFTDEQFYKAKDSGVSNSQLYKQAGNSVTINVVDAIVKELDKSN
ncbi:DNA (cytosine-5-)-methyltransferase [Staphylococcus phage SpP]